MAACIVCNEDTAPEDLNDRTMKTIHSLLEKALDEAVPASAVLCRSCECDLHQIEMYYTLLATFKKRYHDNASNQRKQILSSDVNTKRNILITSTAFNSENLQGILEASNSLVKVDTQLSLQTETNKGTCCSEITLSDIKHELNDARSLQHGQEQNQNIWVEPVSENVQQPNMLENSKWTEFVQRTTKNVLVDAEIGPGYSPPQQADCGDSDSDNTVIDGQDFFLTNKLNTNLIDTSMDVDKLTTIPTKSNGEKTKVEKSCRYDTPSDLQPEAIKLDSVIETTEVVIRKRGRPRKDRPIEFSSSSLMSDRSAVNKLQSGVKATCPAVGPMNSGRSRKHMPERDILSSQSMAHENKGSRSQYIRSYEEPKSDDAILEELDSGVGTSMMGDSKIKGAKEFTLPSNTKPCTSSAIGIGPAPKRKRGRPRKKAQPSIKPIQSEKPAFTETTFCGSSADEAKLNESKNESVAPFNVPTERNLSMSPPPKKKRGRPRKIDSPDCVLVQHSKQKRLKKKEKKSTGKTKIHTCTFCDELLPDLSSLKFHMTTHMGDKSVSCTFCDKEFPSPSALEQHESVHTGKKRFQCEICGKGISRGSSLRMHLSSHKKVKSFECDKCNKKFKNQKYLESHINKHHVQGRHILCNICGKAFFTEKVLKIHLLTHSGERVKSFKCVSCDMLFYTKGELGNHEGTHKDKTERQKHVCTVCGKAFLQKAYLKYHMVVHTGESKHQCSDCNKVFITASEHKKHILKHTGEKPYKCLICGKAFRLSSNYHAHKKTHTGEKPYKCICGASFAVKTMLDRHMSTKKHADFMENLKSNPSVTSLPTAAPVAVTTLIPTQNSMMW